MCDQVQGQEDQRVYQDTSKGSSFSWVAFKNLKVTLGSRDRVIMGRLGPHRDVAA